MNEVMVPVCISDGHGVLVSCHLTHFWPCVCCDNSCRNPVDNTRPLQRRCTDGMSWHTGDDSVYLCTAGCLHRSTALSAPAQQATENQACRAQCY